MDTFTLPLIYRFKFLLVSSFKKKFFFLQIDDWSLSFFFTPLSYRILAYASVRRSKAEEPFGCGVEPFTLREGSDAIRLGCVCVCERDVIDQYIYIHTLILNID